jgi:hypothetical protein
MSALLCLPAELHVEILVWSVVDYFTGVLESQEVVDNLWIGLLCHIQRITNPQLEDDDEDWEFPHDEDVTKMAVAFFAIADMSLKTYLIACPTASLYWDSHRQVILRRAAAECLKTVAFRKKVHRREIARARFQHVLFKVMNPDLHILDVPEEAPAKKTWYRYRLSSMRFWELEVKDLALRRILSDQTMLDKLIETSWDMILAIFRSSGAGLTHLPYVVNAAYRAFSEKSS